MGKKNTGSLLIILALLAGLAFSAEAKTYELENLWARATLIVDGNNIDGSIFMDDLCDVTCPGSESQTCCMDGVDYQFSGTKGSISYVGKREPCIRYDNGRCDPGAGFEPAEGTIDITYDGELNEIIMIIRPNGYAPGKFTFSISEDPFKS